MFLGLVGQVLPHYSSFCPSLHQFIKHRSILPPTLVLLRAKHSLAKSGHGTRFIVYFCSFLAQCLSVSGICKLAVKCLEQKLIVILNWSNIYKSSSTQQIVNAYHLEWRSDSEGPGTFASVPSSLSADMANLLKTSCTNAEAWICQPQASFQAQSIQD